MSPTQFVYYGDSYVGRYEDTGIEAKQWTGEDEHPDDARAQALEQEELREREWDELEALARDFIKSYGAGAMLRCVSHALDK